MKSSLHPSQVFKGLYLEPLERSITDVAKDLGVTRKTLSQFTHGQLGAQKSMLEGVQKEAHKRNILLFEEDVTVEGNFRITPLPNTPIMLHSPGRELSVSKIDIKANVTCRSRNKDSVGVEVRAHNDILEKRRANYTLFSLMKHQSHTFSMNSSMIKENT
ncbi:helix-turn-helix transcriptional regulator [Spirosoma areae]